MSTPQWRKYVGGVLAGALAAVGEELGDVEADAAGADDGDALADGGAVAQHVEVADDVGWSTPSMSGVRGVTPVASDDLVVAGAASSASARGVQPDLDAVRARAGVRK